MCKGISRNVIFINRYKNSRKQRPREFFLALIFDKCKTDLQEVIYSEALF